MSLEENGDGEFEEFKTPDDVKKDLMICLKEELRSKFKSHDIPRNEKGYFTMEFLVDMHALIYKYKMAGHDMIGDAYFKERINILKLAEAEAVSADTAKSNELMQMYQQKLKNSDHRQLDYVDDLTNNIFDYFNIITKEYYLNIDRVQTDTDYTDMLKDAYKKIDEDEKKE